MTTAAPAKPRSAKAIVTTKLTADGMKSVLAKSAQDKLDGAYELVSLLAQVPQWEEAAVKAMEPLGELCDATRKAT